jgi:hypothetical protein
MLVKMETSGSSVGGVQPWVDGVISNSNKTVTFNWSGDAQSYILIFGWTNNERACLYGEIGNNNVSFANSANGWHMDSTWTTLGATVTDTPNSLEITFPSPTWSYAFLVPIADTHTIP